MITVSGTKNHIPVKVSYIGQFMELLKNQNITYKFIGSLPGYFIYEFNSEFDKGSALYYRDTLYEENNKL